MAANISRPLGMMFDAGIWNPPPAAVAGLSSGEYAYSILAVAFTQSKEPPVATSSKQIRKLIEWFILN